MPRARIEVAARPAIAPLFGLTSGVDGLVLLDRKADAVPAVRDRRPDAVLLFTNSFQTAFTAWRAGVPERWGYRADWRGPLWDGSTRMRRV